MGRVEDSELLNVPEFVLKVEHLCCQGCEKKVRKALRKIEGVSRCTIDLEEGKVTVRGNVDPLILIKKLEEIHKPAELLSSEGGNNELNQQFQNMQIEDEGVQKGGKSDKNGKEENTQQPRQKKKKKQFMKMVGGVKDLKLPQLKDLKMPFKKKKSVQFNLPENVLNMDFSGGIGNVGHMWNVPMGQFPGDCPEILPSDPYNQQYMAAMMQQQEMMQQQNCLYAGPSYPQEPFTNYFNDENANGCTIM